MKIIQMKTEVLWQQLIDHGLEHLILLQGDQIEANGLAVGMLKDVAYRIQYQIVCDANWNVQTVGVKNLLNDNAFSLARQGDSWLDEQNHSVEALRGCTEVDIMVTPFTNTLPIRRLNLASDEAKEISVVYVSVPDLSVSKLSQRYTCLSQEEDGGVYRYENLNSGFTSDLKVDSDALVVDYPGIFQMIWKNRMD